MDGRSDIFSLGIVLWEILTGKKLFVGENIYEILRKITDVNYQIPPPSQYNSEIPPYLDQIVLLALDRNINTRIQTAETLQKALKECLIQIAPKFDSNDLSQFLKELFAQEIQTDLNLVRDLNEEADQWLVNNSSQKQEEKLQMTQRISLPKVKDEPPSSKIEAHRFKKTFKSYFAPISITLILFVSLSFLILKRRNTNAHLKNLTTANIESKLVKSSAPSGPPRSLASEAVTIPQKTNAKDRLEVAIKSETINFEEILNSYALYSSGRLKIGSKEKLFVGGWRHPDDHDKYYHQLLDNGKAANDIEGPDKIWMIDNISTKTSENLSKIQLALSLKGYHINDPTLIVPPSDSKTNRSTWVYMYFTMLENDSAEECRRRHLELTKCPHLFQSHSLGMASSDNYGSSWKFVGKIADYKDPLFKGGAWTPSALLSPDKKSIFIYYSSASSDFSHSILFQMQLSLNGWQKLSEPIPVKTADFQPNQEDFIYINPDVKYLNLGTSERPNWKYILLYNNSSQTKILSAHSSDGINFSETNVLNKLPDGPYKLLTPHILSGRFTDGTLKLKYDFSLMNTESPRIQIFSSKF